MNSARFVRPYAGKRYKKLFVIAAEGEKTEPQYFSFFNEGQAIVNVTCIRREKNSAPLQVLQNMQKHLKQVGLHKNDEAWLVVDKDSWLETDLLQLSTWASSKKNYGLALSNPCFEYWLLLHFEDPRGISTSGDCLRRLKRYIPNYDKGISKNAINLPSIQSAINRAALRDLDPDAAWPQLPGSRVYILVKNILSVK